jgi:hypothetical protein
LKIVEYIKKTFKNNNVVGVVNIRLFFSWGVEAEKMVHIWALVGSNLAAVLPSMWAFHHHVCMYVSVF